MDSSGTERCEPLTSDQATGLICTAKSTGGVMGKMIDAQSITVATAATDTVGTEGTIFRVVIGIAWRWPC